MRNLLVILVIACLLGASTRNVSADDADKINQLIRQLGADTYAERENAAKELDKLGAAALEELRKATTSHDVEVRRRASDLVARIRSRVARESVLTPSRVHLDFKDLAITEAVKRFAQTSGFDLVLQDDENKLKDKTITLDTGRVPFWTALQAFCDKAGLVELEPNQSSVVPIRRTGPAPVGLKGAAPPPPPVAPPPAGKEKAKVAEDVVAPPRRNPPRALPPVPPTPTTTGKGSYYVPVPAGRIILVPGMEDRPADTSAAIRVRLADRKRFPIEQSEKEIRLVLEVSVEPRMQLKSVEKVRLDRVSDDNKQTLAAVGQVGNPDAVEGGSKYFLSSNGIQGHQEARIEKGKVASRSLSLLEGVITVHAVSDKEEMLVIESPQKAAGKSVKGKYGGELSIQAVTKQADGSVMIEFHFEAPSDGQPETRYPVAESSAEADLGSPNRRVVAGGIPLPMVAKGQMLYTPWGISLQDDKGNALLAAIRPDFRKGDERTGKEFVAVYLPDKDGKIEPARLVYTGRRLVETQVPFQLAGIDLK